MSQESTRVIRLGLLVGAVGGGVLAVWQLTRGAPLGTALRWAAAVLAVAVVLAVVSVIGIRLQRKDLPRPD